MKLLIFTWILFTLACAKSNNLSYEIILVNVADDRNSEIATQIGLICNQDPSVLAIDIAFDKEDSLGDSALTNALWNCKKLLIPTEIYSLGDSLMSIALMSEGRFCPTFARTGFVSSRAQDGLTKFSLYETPSFSQRIEYHFSVQAAMLYDSVSVAEFVRKSPRIMDLDFKVPRRKFRIVSGSSISRGEVKLSDFKDRIVIMGYLGPGNFDQVITPWNTTGEKMYGVELLSNITAQILDSAKGASRSR